MIPSALFSRCAPVLVAALTLVTAATTKADIIELVNGDHYRGTVISMTLTNVEFQSEIQGRVKLPRDKVAQITLRETITKPASNAPVASQPEPHMAAPLILSGPSVTVNAPIQPGSAVIQQMRQQGVDPKLVDQVQQQIFGQSSPAASQKFNELMNGLTSGSLSMQDLRTQAQSSIDQIKSAKKELGGDAGDMLDGYLGILEQFMNESKTDTTLPATTPNRVQ